MYKFCPICRSSLIDKTESEGVKRQVCLNCGFIYYPVSKPCAGVLVLKDTQILLIRRGIEPFKDYWDIPGGFLEQGEHPVDGAIREVREETGLKIKPLEILGIYMDEYGPEREATLNICYTANVIGGEPRAGSDAKAMEWFDLEKLPGNIAFEWSKKAINQLRSMMK